MLATVVSVVLVNPPAPVVVNANEPSPPCVFFTRMIVDCFTLSNVQVVVPPAATVKLALVPVVHVGASPCCQPVGIVSPTLNVFVGSTLVYVCAAVLADVVSVVLLNPPPPVVVNANEPSPPCVFFTRMIVDCFVLSNVQVVVPPAATVKLALVPVGQAHARPPCPPHALISPTPKVYIGSTFVN